MHQPSTEHCGIRGACLLACWMLPFANNWASTGHRNAGKNSSQHQELLHTLFFS
jgi:hypothetical protein